MDASVKLNDFVTMQTSMTAKVNASDYKNDAFYGFMKQTAETQKTSSNNNVKKNTSDSSKKENVDAKEDVTKPETQPKEETTEKEEDVKDNMLQQVDMALFTAAVNTNIVPVENQTMQTVEETSVVPTEVLTVQTNQNADTTQQQTASPVDTMQQQNQNVEQKPVQQSVQSEKVVSDDTPQQTEKAIEVQPKQEQTTQTNAAKTEVKTDTAQTAEEVVVVEETAQTENKSDTAQANTSEEDADSFENEAPNTNRKTFSDDVINIKVGENAQIADAEMAQKVSDKMLAKFAQHENEFEIQLTPKELGKITIKLVMENGQAHVSMFAENAKTSSLLAEKAREISAIIEHSTGNETNVEVIDKKEMENQEQNKQSKGDGFTRQQEEQQRQHKQRIQAEHAADFIQQMRLGLWYN